ncbi:hypothetical protein [Rhizobium aouanii]
MIQTGGPRLYANIILHRGMIYPKGRTPRRLSPLVR